MQIWKKKSYYIVGIICDKVNIIFKTLTNADANIPERVMRCVMRSQPTCSVNTCGPSFINQTKIQQPTSAFPPLVRWISQDFCFVRLESDLLESAGLFGSYPPSKSLQTDLTSWYKVTVCVNHVTPLCFSVGEDRWWRKGARGNAKKGGFSKGEGCLPEKDSSIHSNV